MSSSKKPVSLYLTRLTPALWAQFYHWYDVRKEDHHPVAPPGGCGSWVVKEPEGKIEVNGIALPEGTPELVAGCCFFPCVGDSPYAVIEFVSTNPHLPARVTHAAVKMICMATSHWGAMTGKTPICFPKHKGVKRLMRKFGYGDVKPEVQVLYPPLFVHVGLVGGEADPEPYTKAQREADKAALAEPGSVSTEELLERLGVEEKTEQTSSDARMSSAHAAE